MPKLLSALTGKTSSAALFEIRHTKDVIVLHGDQDSAASQLLTGIVVLTLHQTLKVEEVYLKMSGMLKISWPEKRYHQETDTSNVHKHCEIYTHKWSPFLAASSPGSASKGSMLHPGTYEWPFDLVIPGTMPESIEGLGETNLTYKLKATVARGKLAHDLHAWKSIRIVRTPDFSDTELTLPMSVENIWPDKIEYSVMVQQKAIMLGTSIEIEMKFAKLLKGLKIGNIKCQIYEMTDLVVGSNSRPDLLKSHKSERLVGTWNFQISEENYQEILFENGRDGHVLNEKLPLPKSLSECVQDCDTHGIKVRHKVKFNISLHNPDGHLSELRATIPVTIYSPSSSFAATGDPVVPGSESAHAMGNLRHAPPLYGDHVLDQLWGDSQQTGLMTPATQSGMNTPAFSRSRAGSYENLSSLDGAISPLSHYSATIGAVPPAALSSRLQNITYSSRNSSFRRLTGLGSSGYSTPHFFPNTEVDYSSYFDGYHRAQYQHNSGSNSGYSSNQLSRRSSGDAVDDYSRFASGQLTPMHSDVSDLEGLSKVPSYRTVQETNLGDLPNYETVLSAPPSPKPNFGTLATPPSSVDGSADGSTTTTMSSASNGSTAAMTSPNLTHENAHDRRRFLSLQNRGRGAAS